MPCPKRMACSVLQTRVGVETQRIARKCRAGRAVDFQFVIRMEHPRLHLVRRETEALLERADVFNHLLHRADLAAPRLRIRIAEERIRRERHAVTQPPAQNVANRHAPRLPQDIEAREFERRQHLRPVVVQRGGGVGDQEPHLFQAHRIAAHQIRFHGAKDRLGRFPAAAHFAQPDDAVIGFHFHNGAHEPAPMAAIGMAQGRFQRYCHRGGPDILNPHILFHRTTMSDS